jgi:hypothetical protein
VILWNRVVLEELVICHMVRQFCALSGIVWSIAVFTRRYTSLSSCVTFFLWWRLLTPRPTPRLEKEPEIKFLNITDILAHLFLVLFCNIQLTSELTVLFCFPFSFLYFSMSTGTLLSCILHSFDNFLSYVSCKCCFQCPSSEICSWYPMPFVTQQI